MQSCSITIICNDYCFVCELFSIFHWGTCSTCCIAQHDHLAPQAYPGDEIVVHPTDMYATVEDKRKPPLVPGARRDNAASNLAGPYAAVQRRRSSGENPQQVVDDHMYSVVNKPRRQRSAEDVLGTQPVIQEMYATVDKTPKKTVRRYTPENAPDDLYSLPDRRKRSDNPPEDFYSLPDRRRRAAEKPPEDFYSLPDRRRKAVKVKHPPPVAPKPKPEKARRSPTPKGRKIIAIDCNVPYCSFYSCVALCNSHGSDKLCWCN